MQTCPYPLEQHFSKPEQSSSPCQASTQMPIWSGLGLGQNSGFPSAAGNFNIILMLIFCYSVLAEQFSSLLSSSSSSSSLLLSLSFSIFFPWNTNYAGSYYWRHFKQEQFCLHYSTGRHKTTMFIYMGAWASQATVPFIQHICRYVQISSNIYKRKNRSTKAGHENPKKPAGGKNTGNVYPRPRQWCNPWGFRVC